MDPIGEELDRPKAHRRFVADSSRFTFDFPRCGDKRGGRGDLDVQEAGAPGASGKWAGRLGRLRCRGSAYCGGYLRVAQERADVDVGGARLTGVGVAVVGVAFAPVLPPQDPSTNKAANAIAILNLKGIPFAQPYPSSISLDRLWVVGPNNLLR